MLTADGIESILAAIPHRTIGLVGDLFLDRYFDIDPALDEPSVETGLTAYQVVGVRSYPGALGTVVNNLSALGVGRIVPFSIVGDDGEGYELRRSLGLLPGVDPSQLIVAPDRFTPTYAKPMRGGTELHRLDTKNRTPTPAKLIDALLQRADGEAIDAWLVLDQVSERDCGVVGDAVRAWAARLSKFVLADSRERIHKFHGVCVKPNEREAKSLDPSRVAAAFVTLGERGIRLIEGAHETLVPAYPVTGPTDICGAGDSCSAGILAAVVSGMPFADAAAFGNLIASITVTQIGVTGTATPGQVRNRWAELAS
jgi:bifunctional ADP-heptose synthase (sugar kinase/adenylyltransferase)